MGNVKRYQQRLFDLGFDPGPIDGVRGRLTIRAIKAFQHVNGLETDGIIGPKTLAKLDGRVKGVRQTKILNDDKPWLDEANRMRGVTEIPGKRHNRTIMDWARDLGIWYSDDETPWCGLFVAHCIGSQMPNEVLPINPLGARNWLKFGTSCDAVPGAIVVLWRGKRSGWKGHVGMVVGTSATHVYVLAGNQSNQVNVRKFLRVGKKSRVLGYRWPCTAMLAPRRLAMSGGISTDGKEA